MPDRIAYLPLDTHPEAVTDDAVLSAIGLAAALGCKLHVSAFAVNIPPVASPLGGGLINIDGMVRAAEDRSRAECKRLKALIEGKSGAGAVNSVTIHEVAMGGVSDAATTEARYFDLSILPCLRDAQATQDLAQTLVFGTGLPVVLVPPEVGQGSREHIAVAWDESRVAARALGDALRLLALGGHVTVLTVHDEKTLRGSEISADLVASLRARGYAASALDLALSGRPIAEVLQDGAIAAGAGLMAMGGYGHSRLRDFILGGATKGVLADLRMPVLLSH